MKLTAQKVFRIWLG